MTTTDNSWVLITGASSCFGEDATRNAANERSPIHHQIPASKNGSPAMLRLQKI